MDPKVNPDALIVALEAFHVTASGPLDIQELRQIMSSYPGSKVFTANGEFFAIFSSSTEANAAQQKLGQKPMRDYRHVELKFSFCWRKMCPHLAAQRECEENKRRMCGGYHRMPHKDMTFLDETKSRQGTNFDDWMSKAKGLLRGYRHLVAKPSIRNILPLDYPHLIQSRRNPSHERPSRDVQAESSESSSSSNDDAAFQRQKAQEEPSEEQPEKKVVEKSPPIIEQKVAPQENEESPVRTIPPIPHNPAADLPAQYGQQERARLDLIDNIRKNQAQKQSSTNPNPNPNPPRRRPIVPSPQKPHPKEPGQPVRPSQAPVVQAARPQRIQAVPHPVRQQPPQAQFPPAMSQPRNPIAPMIYSQPQPYVTSVPNGYILQNQSSVPNVYYQPPIPPVPPPPRARVISSPHSGSFMNNSIDEPPLPVSSEMGGVPIASASSLSPPAKDAFELCYEYSDPWKRCDKNQHCTWRHFNFETGRDEKTEWLKDPYYDQKGRNRFRLTHGRGGRGRGRGRRRGNGRSWRGSKRNGYRSRPSPSNSSRHDEDDMKLSSLDEAPSSRRARAKNHKHAIEEDMNHKCSCDRCASVRSDHNMMKLDLERQKEEYQKLLQSHYYIQKRLEEIMEQQENGSVHNAAETLGTVNNLLKTQFHFRPL